MYKSSRLKHPKQDCFTSDDDILYRIAIIYLNGSHVTLFLLCIIQYGPEFESRLKNKSGIVRLISVWFYILLLYYRPVSRDIHVVNGFVFETPEIEWSRIE